MAVLRIEEYEDVLKVILKPTKKFPVGYFYTDNNQIARELIKNYAWSLRKEGKNIYVCTHKGANSIYFHTEYAFKVLGYYPNLIDHVNRVEFDNRDINLNVVSKQQNNRNKLVKGYLYSKTKNISHFTPKCTLNFKDIIRSSYNTESEALIAVFWFRRQVFYDYDYNFFLDRKYDLDILDMEITGRITSQNATKLHVKRYVESNPWYAYRYNLFEYCKQNNIVIPDFSLDSQGFMINPVTKERLCPY